MLTALCSHCGHKVDNDISIIHVSKSITGCAAINWMSSRSGVQSYSQRLLEEAGKLLPVKDLAIVNVQFPSLDKAGFFAIG